MSLHNLETTLTPDELEAIAACVRHTLSSTDGYLERMAERAANWAAAQSERFYLEWEALPPGSHLKAAYADRVWTWSDRDLEALEDLPDEEANKFEKPTK